MNLLYLTILFPLIGFLLLAFSRGRWSENLSAAIGMGSVGLAALVTLYVGIDFFANGQQPFSQALWTWMQVGTPHQSAFHKECRPWSPSPHAETGRL